MTFGAHQFTNKGFDFVEGMFIGTDSPFSEFHVFGSHQNNKQSWEPIYFSTERHLLKFTPDEQPEIFYYLRFNHPINHLYLRLDFSGEEIDHKKIRIKFTIPKPFGEAKHFMKTKKIGFLGLTRNCAHSVEKIVAEILRIGQLFGDFHIFFLENNSTDQTRAIIQKLSTSCPINLIYFDDLDTCFPSRTARLSFCRNTLLRLTKDLGFDYVMAFDADGIFGQVDTDAFIDCFRFETCWDGCFPVKTPYYDAWAFRHSRLVFDDYASSNECFPKVIGDENIYRFTLLPLRNLDFSKFKGWLPVESAFGGFGLYKASSYYQSYYWGSDDGGEICEHVPFHSQMRRKGAKLYLNPNLRIF